MAASQSQKNAGFMTKDLHKSHIPFERSEISQHLSPFQSNKTLGCDMAMKVQNYNGDEEVKSSNNLSLFPNYDQSVRDYDSIYD
jgi:hypothetical protein